MVERRVRVGRRMKMSKSMTGLELLNRAAVCCTARRIGASQVAVLTAVALRPGITSGGVEMVTGLSKTHVGNLLAYLRGTEDVVFTREYGKDYKTLRKRWFLTATGARTVEDLLKGMGWDKRDRFRIVPVGDVKRWEI